MDKRKQVADQCKAVAHMAKALADVYTDKAALFASDAKGPDDILDLVGRWSASHMETLGDILNGMDAVEEEADEWLTPIFREAQRLWPTDESAFPERLTGHVSQSPS